MNKYKSYPFYVHNMQYVDGTLDIVCSLDSCLLADVGMAHKIYVCKELLHKAHEVGLNKRDKSDQDPKHPTQVLHLRFPKGYNQLKSLLAHSLKAAIIKQY